MKRSEQRARTVQPERLQSAQLPRVTQPRHRVVRRAMLANLEADRELLA
jgi:hypothetical protein